MVEYNKTGVLVGETDFVVGLDETSLKKLKPKELAAKYCRTEALLTKTVNLQVISDLEKTKFVYEQEFFRRAMQGEIHPDDFEKYCDEWFAENDKEQAKPEKLNSEHGYN